MKTKQEELISKLYKYAKEFDENLANYRVMIISEDDNKKIEKDEILFSRSTFYHLTGVKVIDNNGKEFNSMKFYNSLLRNKVSPKSVYIKDNTTNLKLQILKDLMYIDKTAKMIGDYSASNIYLQTNKLIGNVYACMGLVKSNKGEYYIPNTALKEDIRKITSNRKKVIAILKRKINEKKYKNITYLKRGYDLKDIINQLGLKDVIEVMECNIK